MNNDVLSQLENFAVPMAREPIPAAPPPFAQRYPAEHAWISTSTFGFAQAMRDTLKRYPNLTDGQLAAVRKCMAREAPKAPAPVVSDSGRRKMVDSFAAARRSGIEWPKLRTGDFTFSLAGVSSKCPGCIYVKTGSVYLGKITPEGEFCRSYDCTPEREKEIVAVCADPLAAAVAYGKKTGRCSCCGARLTNALSVSLGIGPICRGNFGW